jgi:hypothetical protein
MSKEVLERAALGIIHLRRIYRIPVRNFSTGHVYTRRLATLSAEDCRVLGYVALVNDLVDDAFPWFSMTDPLVDNENTNSMDFPAPMRSGSTTSAESEINVVHLLGYQQTHIDLIIRMLKESQIRDQLHTSLITLLRTNEQRETETDATKDQDKEIHHWHQTSSSHDDMYSKYSDLCSGYIGMVGLLITDLVEIHFFLTAFRNVNLSVHYLTSNTLPESENVLLRVISF